MKTELWILSECFCLKHGWWVFNIILMSLLNGIYLLNMWAIHCIFWQYSPPWTCLLARCAWLYLDVSKCPSSHRFTYSCKSCGTWCPAHVRSLVHLVQHIQSSCPHSSKPCPLSPTSLGNLAISQFSIILSHNLAFRHSSLVLSLQGRLWRTIRFQNFTIQENLVFLTCFPDLFLFSSASHISIFSIQYAFWCCDLFILYAASIIFFDLQSFLALSTQFPGDFRFWASADVWG